MFLLIRISETLLQLADNIVLLTETEDGLITKAVNKFKQGEDKYNITQIEKTTCLSAAKESVL